MTNCQNLINFNLLMETGVSKLGEQRYITRFTGNEFYLNDHQINGQKVLPGAAYLEMARAAGEFSGEVAVSQIRNILWIRPLVVNSEQEVEISLRPGGDTRYYQVITTNNCKKTVYAQGQLIFGKPEKPGNEVIDIDAVRNRCPKQCFREDCYSLFQQAGYNYGPSFQTIEHLYYGENEVLSRLKILSGWDNGDHQFLLHPSIIDGAFQTIMGLRDTAMSVYVPFSVRQVEIEGRLSRECYVYAIRAENVHLGDGEKRLHVWLVNEKGQVLVRIRDLVLKKFDRNISSLK